MRKIGRFIGTPAFSELQTGAGILRRTEDGEVATVFRDTVHMGGANCITNSARC